MNDANYVVCPTNNGKKGMCPYYLRWRDMLRRCYSNKCQQRYPTYRGCEVDERWHSFMTFRAWMIEQPWQGQHLDKDFVGNGKEYSPESCRFISAELNKLFNDHGNARGDLPQGVRRLGSGYLARLSINGKLISKYFRTIQAASDWYLEKKTQYVESLYPSLDADLVRGCKTGLAFIRYPTLKALCQ